MSEFRFVYPAALVLLSLPLFLFTARLAKWVDRRPPALLFSDTRLVGNLRRSWRARLRSLPDWLRSAAWCLLVIGLARPQSGQTQTLLLGQGVEIVMALDISGSMRALDFDPQNRLEAAKEVIAQFVLGRNFDRIGLVVFAQEAYHVVPPTLDYGALLRSLDQVRIAPEIGLVDGTAIGLGLASAANMLRASDAPSRVVILLTDGANNAGSLGPVSAAQLLAALNIRVYTVGMGKPGLVPIPDDQGNRQLIESDLDEAALQAVSTTTNGQYFRAEDLTNLRRIYDLIDVLERSDVERQVLIEWQDLAWGFLWLGLMVMFAERVLRHSVLQTVP